MDSHLPLHDRGSPLWGEVKKHNDNDNDNKHKTVKAIVGQRDQRRFDSSTPDSMAMQEKPVGDTFLVPFHCSCVSAIFSLFLRFCCLFLVLMFPLSFPCSYVFAVFSSLLHFCCLFTVLTFLLSFHYSYVSAAFSLL